MVCLAPLGSTLLCDIDLPTKQSHLRLLRFVLWIALATANGLAGSCIAQEDDSNVSWDGSYLPKVIPGATHGTLLQSNPVVGTSAVRATSASGYKSVGQSVLPTRTAPTGVTSTSEIIMLDELVPLDTTPIRTASLNTQTIPNGTELVDPQATQTPGSQLPPGTRNGVFQKIRMSGTWAPTLTDDPDALGVTDLDTSVVLGFPFLRIDTPLLVTPRFGIHFFDNAASNDLPSRVYDVSTEFRHLRRFGAGPWAMDAAVSVGYYSDFDQDSGDAIRVNGRLLGVYESSPAAKWIFGAVYLNRAGTNLLPAAGLIYTPDDATKYELIFPRPRAAWQLAGSQPNDQRWFYVGGEFGGGVWSITRPSTGMLDTANYSDLRLITGIERKVIGGLSHHLEFGYVFYRKLEFERPAIETQLDDTVFVRAGISY
ncbi:DUF6268 family outer membrane beta-barrel protein [Adhaeretor mobilis]|uniref:DUF6268 domain-containing protein n=1 Tax=Adhaeretor mobilis TaxID=1930276 RepID=A0A517MVX0_9BACT|nr:DUF6268 family outer membrane beta-barrel protein [Adhaeretor mobilis]QDS99021.1 hypothetical protein HG15A2_23100 [Adhaeretor mobilis]